MDPELVFRSRIQFALTIMFHYLFPPLTIGFEVVLVDRVIAIATLFAAPRAMTTLNQMPWLWIVPLLTVLAILNISREIHRGIERYAR